MHAKGTDYTEQSVPERATVRAVGGRVAIAGDPKSHATQDLIAHHPDPLRPDASRDRPRCERMQPGRISGPALLKIAIVKLSSLGDVIHALPVARALRRARPGST